MSRTRDIARIMGKTEAGNPSNASLLSGTASMTVYSTLDSLPIDNLTNGDQAFVNATNRLYISNGTGWYNVALVNRNPRWDSGGEPDAEYEIADSVTPLIITARAADSDNLNLLNQSAATDSAQHMVTISNDSSVWTFTPKSADSIGASVLAGDLTDSNGDFIYTFKWSDGVNFVSKAVTITYNPAGGAGFDRALFFGGTQSSGGTDRIQYMSIPTGGSTTDFGDMITARGGCSSFGNAGRSVVANGEVVGGANRQYASSMEYVSPSTPGNGTTFGTNDTGKAFGGAVADLTRGVMAGGAYYSGSWTFREMTHYVTIDTTSNSSYFGGLGWGWAVGGSAKSGDNTYGFFTGGVRSSDTNYIAYRERITIQTTGTASSVGSFSNGYARAYSDGFSDGTYTFVAGGINGGTPSYLNSVDRHSIATGGTGTNVATLNSAKYSLAATNNATSGVTGGGSGDYTAGNIEEINMSTNAIAVNFGSLAVGSYRLSATSGAG